MKLLLQIVGGLSILGGLAMFGMTIATTSYLPGIDPNTPRLIAVAWLLAGAVGSVIPFGLAEVIGRLEDLEARR
jgi:hypothetical protein